MLLYRLERVRRVWPEYTTRNSNRRYDIWIFLFTFGEKQRRIPKESHCNDHSSKAQSRRHAPVHADAGNLVELSRTIASRDGENARKTSDKARGLNEN